MVTETQWVLVALFAVAVACYGYVLWKLVRYTLMLCEDKEEC